MMKLGTAKAVITPPIGTPLAGFSSRTHGCEGVADNLELRTIWLQNGDSDQDAVCIITADLLGFDESTVALIRNELNAVTGISPDRVLLAASHTHSGPQLLPAMVCAGMPVPAVVKTICRTILHSVKESRNSLRDVSLHAGRGECPGFAVNRRGMVDGEYWMVPNPDGIRDDEVVAISFQDEESGKVLAVLFQFTCHPSTMASYDVTADYPGAARKHIEDALGDGSVAAFLPGCFGDIRTNAVIAGGSRFRVGIPEDIAAFGSALGSEVLRIVRGETVLLTPGLGGRISAVELEFDGHPTRDELELFLQSEDEEEREWADRMLSETLPTSRSFSIQRIDLAEEAMLVAMSGEVVCDYGRYIKSLRRRSFAVPMGYSNGILSYIPTSTIIAEGGYEGLRANRTYGLPSAFKPEMECRIKSAIRELMA